jgi:putative transposase
LWRGRSARGILDSLHSNHDARVLQIMSLHANGKAQYSVWKEQVRALAIKSELKLRTIVSYIHNNPVRRGLVQSPDQWELSSFAFYECGMQSLMLLTPPDY